MFINRKSRKLTRNQIFNQSEQILEIYKHKNVQIVSYPILEYVFGCLLIGVSIYFLYSAGGGINGIKGFNQKLWWQFLCSLLPMVFGVCFILACQIESLAISRKENRLIITKTRFFCFITEEKRKQFDDLIGLSVIKTGKQKNNITMTSYQIVLSFKTCEEISVLRSLSETKILDYFEELRRVFNQDEISQKRVVIQNLTS